MPPTLEPTETGAVVAGPMDSDHSGPTDATDRAGARCGRGNRSGSLRRARYPARGRLTRSSSAITSAPNKRIRAPASKVNRTMIAVASDP